MPPNGTKLKALVLALNFFERLKVALHQLPAIPSLMLLCTEMSGDHYFADSRMVYFFSFPATALLSLPVFMGSKISSVLGSAYNSWKSELAGKASGDEAGQGIV